MAGACTVDTCDAGWGDCDGVAANGCEVDTNTSNAFCGDCGNNNACAAGSCCSAGACNAGACAVVSVANAVKVGDQACLALNDTHVFYTTHQFPGQIMKVAKSGGVPVAITSNQAGPAAIAVGGGYVFWTTPSTGGVKRSDLDGANYKDLYNIGAGAQPRAIDVDATHVYWVDAALGDVWQMNHDGTNVVHLAAGETQPDSIALDATSVYWNNSGTGDVRKATKGVAGSAQALVTGGTFGTHAIAVNATDVYWSRTSVPGSILTSSASMPSVTGGLPFAINQTSPWSIALDAKSVYWADLAMPGSIMKQPLKGAVATTLAQNQPAPICLAVDGSTVYWLNVGAGSVLETAK